MAATIWLSVSDEKNSPTAMKRGAQEEEPDVAADDLPPGEAAQREEAHDDRV